MDAVTKSIEATVIPVESENPNGEFEVILATDDLDRDDENLWADEWQTPLPDKIHFDSDHAWSKGLSVPHTVGSAVPTINEKGQVVCHGVFAGTEHGQLVRQLVNEKHVWQASASFIEHKNKGDGHMTRELLNGTFTGVPANPKAVVLSSKSAKQKTVPETDPLVLALALARLVLKTKSLAGAPGAPSVYDDGYDETDTDRDAGSEPDHDEDDPNDEAQSVHDAAVALGAECASKTYHDNVVSLHEKAAAPAADTATNVPVSPAVSPADVARANRMRKFRLDTHLLQGENSNG